MIDAMDVDGRWHSRGYLPHFEQPGAIQMITFRLADSLPPEVIETLEREARAKPDDVRRRRLDAYLDAGYGECLFRDRRAARAIEETLRYGDGRRYRLLAWVVMPNHVHVLVETLGTHPLAEIVQAWKSLSARQINHLLGRRGRVWQPDYFDRVIRDERHLQRAIEYVHGNPIQAGLVDRPELWPHSSAREQTS